jgi:LmbE family N-acetylglucosaminyl deacetylase
MNMRSFIDELNARGAEKAPLVLGLPEAGERFIPSPEGGDVLVLAPHMDDPDAVAVTLRRFAGSGCSVRCLIVCSSHGGVTDNFALDHARKNGRELDRDEIPHYKRGIRQAEQIESVRLGAFTVGPPEFLAVEEDERGNLTASDTNALTIAEALSGYDPDIVIMPHGEDTNAAHVNVHRFFRRAAAHLAARRGRPLLGLYNRDAKTLRITEQLAVPFDIEASEWKSGLLKAHRSQHERNLELRGYGFDERVLRVNRGAWDELAGKIGESWTSAYPFAETFQAESFS